MRIRAPLIQIAHEVIGYQSKSTFFAELTQCMQDMISGGVISSTTLKECGAEDVIRRHTGLNVDLRLERDSFPNGHVHLTRLDVNTIFDEIVKLEFGVNHVDDWRKTAKQLRRLDPSLTGTIDLKNGRVSGIFSKAKAYITLTSGNFTVNTAPQIAATLLHECGHVFYGYWAYTKTVLTNIAIYSASASLNKARSMEERLEFVTSFAAVTQSKIEDPKAVAAEQKSPEEYQAILLQATTRIAKETDSGAYIYDLTSFEYMADQFAAMWGAGREAAIELDRFNGLVDKRYKQTLAQHVASEAMEWSLASLKNIFKVAFPPFMYFFPIVTLSVMRYEWRDVSRYDNPIDRIVRIKQSMIQALKDLSLPADDKKKLTDDILFIDSLIKDSKDYRPLLDVIWTALKQSRRNRFNQKQFQKELEFTINNNLFVHSSRLSQLAQSAGD